MQLTIMRAIFINQVKDFVKNMERVIMFIVFPLVAYIMTATIANDEIPQNMFVAMFATMHIIFSTVMVTSTIVAEEKEKRTLRELMLADVSIVEFLISVGFFILLCTMITSISFVLMGDYEGERAVYFMIYVFVGSTISILFGMSLGLLAKNLVSVNAYAMPAGMLLSFGPMLAGFNDKIYAVSKFTYGQRISDWVQEKQIVNLEGILVVVVNAVLILLLFCYTFHKNRKDS